MRRIEFHFSVELQLYKSNLKKWELHTHSKEVGVRVQWWGRVPRSKSKKANFGTNNFKKVTLGEEKKIKV